MEKHILLSHEERKSFQCPLCQIKFGQDINVKEHFQIVHVEKKYECCYCLAILPSKNDTDKHIARFHEIRSAHEIVLESPEEQRCSVCFKIFGRKADLKRHFATVHEGKRPFECFFCPSKFSQKLDMNNHVTFVHEEMTYLPHRLT